MEKIPLKNRKEWHGRLESDDNDDRIVFIKCVGELWTIKISIQAYDWKQVKTWFTLYYRYCTSLYYVFNKLLKCTKDAKLK